MNWQLIDTAPKDGTLILAWNGAQMTTVRWYDLGRYWEIAVAQGYEVDDEFWKPTHWHVAPPPPSEG